MKLYLQRGKYKNMPFEYAIGCKSFKRSMLIQLRRVSWLLKFSVTMNNRTGGRRYGNQRSDIVDDLRWRWHFLTLLLLLIEMFVVLIMIRTKKCNGRDERRKPIVRWFDGDECYNGIFLRWNGWWEETLRWCTEFNEWKFRCIRLIWSMWNGQILGFCVKRLILIRFLILCKDLDGHPKSKKHCGFRFNRYWMQSSHFCDWHSTANDRQQCSDFGDMDTWTIVS